MYKCHAGEAGTLWSFNFFLYNRKAKRMLYFSCRGVSKSVGSSESRYYTSPLLPSALARSRSPTSPDITSQHGLQPLCWRPKMSLLLHVHKVSVWQPSGQHSTTSCENVSTSSSYEGGLRVQRVQVQQRRGGGARDPLRHGAHHGRLNTAVPPAVVRPTAVTFLLLRMVCHSRRGAAEDRAALRRPPARRPLRGLQRKDGACWLRTGPVRASVAEAARSAHNSQAADVAAGGPCGPSAAGGTALSAFVPSWLPAACPVDAHARLCQTLRQQPRYSLLKEPTGCHRRRAQGRVPCNVSRRVGHAS